MGESLIMLRRIAFLMLIFAALLPLSVSVQASDDLQSWGCFQQPRLVAGGQGRVTVVPSLPNRLRSSPSFNAVVLGYIPAGAAYSVLSGPQCSSGVNWWQVRYNGVMGWTAEGDGYYTYWLEPSYVPPPVCTLPTRLTIGGQGRVTPGLPNVMRSAPGTQRSGFNGTVIGQIPGGGVFSVLNGPQCASDSRWWWQVNYNGLIGWTAEGEGYTYWLEPWVGASSCPNALPLRLIVRGAGRVGQGSYYTTVALYLNASFYSYSVGAMPRGALFSVIGGPTCAENAAWWQVNYNGVIGWAVESYGSSYWLDPA